MPLPLLFSATFFILKYAKANSDYASSSVPVPALCSDFFLHESYTACPSWINKADSTPSTADQMDWKRNGSMGPCVHSNMPYVRIYTEKQAYRTGENITFQAVTEEPEALGFLWQFGDQTITTTSSTFIRRYLHPDRYDVRVRVVSRCGSVSSDIYPVVIQKAVQINRLVYSRSVLLNLSVQISCRINDGTDLIYLWDFGDGTQRPGWETEYHVFNRTGEFVIKVTAYNLVSSASLEGHMFIVSEPCQPPPVKNMGPSKIQVWRYQPLYLGVTYEAELQCNISRGLHYSWTIYDPNQLELPIKHIDTNQQSIKLPEFLLHYGTYRAEAKVQILGSIVYSNYSVLIEVMPSAPVSIISGGTNLFINRYNGEAKLTLDAQRSYDPDYSDTILGWNCRPMNSAQSFCFSENIAASFSVLTFPISALKSNCDLFRFTLTVHSGNRSSKSEVFITLRSKPTSIIHVSCKQCRGNSVNWDERFSVTAACESCLTNISYSWNLYIVNASSKSVPDEMFCGSLDISLASRLEADTPFPAFAFLSSSNDKEPVMRNKHHRFVTLGRRKRTVDLHETDSASDRMASGAGSELNLSLFDQPVYSEKEQYLTPESTNVHEYLDYEDIYSGIEEADPGLPVGRPSGPHSLDHVIPHLSEFEGDNLVGPSTSGHVVYEKTLLDLHRELIHPALFDSYTVTGGSTTTGQLSVFHILSMLNNWKLFCFYFFWLKVLGITSSFITFKPRMLKPKSLYMLEVSAGYDQAVQGKAQLFFSTHPAPKGMSCHVQPSAGLEIHTQFSIFCTSGKEDLLYEYSFKVGNSTKRRLYRGRDYQHYFHLPSGDPYDDSKVVIYIETWNKFGASTNPCAVNVTVWPSLIRNSSAQSDPVQELFVYGLKNLTNLIQTKNTQNILNYVFLLTPVLNRLSLPAGPGGELQTLTRATLINAICLLNVTDRDLLLDVLHVLTDLLKVSTQVTFDCVKLVVKYIQHLASLELNKSDVRVMETRVFILSYLLETQIPSSSLGVQLTHDVLHLTADSVQMYMLSSRNSHCSLNSSSSIKVETWQHHSFPTPTKTIDATTFYIPQMLERSCFITQLVSYRKNPYHWGRAPTQLKGNVADMKLFNCSSRTEIKMRYLTSPVVIEFQKQGEKNRSQGMRFTLYRSDVITHQFNITTKLLLKAMQITVEFRRPSQRPFPILLLFRMNYRPTPAVYNVRTVYSWKGAAAQIFLPPSSVNDLGSGYLMLLNADYDKTLRHKYIAEAVNYTLSIESSQCLVWDGVRDWRSDGCLTMQSFSSSRINCSCDKLSSFTVSHQKIRSMASISSITLYTSVRTNLKMCIVLMGVVSLYVVFLINCKRADVQTERSVGSFLMPDNNPSDQFLYTVTVVTGLRSRSRMTAKVYIVLYGEDGVSQTRELSDTDHDLFTCNSTQTFILSSEQSLGRIWQVHVWHDSKGSSPSWFLKHVTVKNLNQGSSWIFLAQCWLALDEGDGRIERKLLALERQLMLRELFCLNLTECLKDFHHWLSVYSRPSYSAHTHSQRLSVCLLLLQLYMCANSVLVYLQEDQYWCESGLIGVSVFSVMTGLCALVLLPLGCLVSYLFRINKPNKQRSCCGDQYKVRLPNIFSVEDYRDAFLLKQAESNLSCSPVSPWKQKSEVLKACDSVCVSCNKTSDSSSYVEATEKNITAYKENIENRSFKHSKCDLQSSSFTVNMKHGYCRTLQTWCYYATWALWLLLSISCLIITAALGQQFSSTKVLLWVQSVFFSLIFCVFAAQPAMVLIIAVFVTLWHRERAYFCQNVPADEPVIELLRVKEQAGVHVGMQGCSVYPNEVINMDFKKVMVARQRARYLRLARPPTSTQLKHARYRVKKRKLLYKTIRELLMYIITLSVVGFVAYGKSSNDQFHLNQELRTQFSRSHLVQKADLWWNWTANTLLPEVYRYSQFYSDMEHNVKNKGKFFLIGDPVIKKMEDTINSYQVFSLWGVNSSSCSSALDPGVFSAFYISKRCGKLRCYEGTGINVHLGRNRSEASITVLKLWTSGWMNRSTLALMIQFTVYSPAYNLFSTVTVLGEKSAIGFILPLTDIHSTRIQQSSLGFNYCVTAGELLLLLLGLLHLYFHIHVLIQRRSSSLMNLWNWIEVIPELLSVLCLICTVHHYTLSTNVLEIMQREDFKTFVDLSSVSSWEQLILSFHGLLMFLFLMKCISVLCRTGVIKVAVSTTLIFSKLFWPLVYGMSFIFALFSLENLLFYTDSPGLGTFSSVISQCFSMKKLLEPNHRTRPSVMLCFYLALYCMVATTLRAMVTGALMSALKTTKRKRRKIHLSISDISAYVLDGILALAGRQRKKQTDNDNTNNLVLEEFEDLVDELLVRLSVISSPDLLPGDERDFEGQSLLHSAYDYSSEVIEENRMSTSESSSSHRESRLRSPLEYKSLGGTIPHWVLHADQEILLNSSASPVQKIENMQTFHYSHQTIIVKASETQSSNNFPMIKKDLNPCKVLNKVCPTDKNTTPSPRFTGGLLFTSPLWGKKKRV